MSCPSPGGDNRRKTLFPVLFTGMLFLLCFCLIIPVCAQVQAPVIGQVTPKMALAPKNPVADFSADIMQGPVPLTVQFMDTSLNSPTSWLWDLNGDGKIDSQTKNPRYTYQEPGTYTVTVTVANSAGKDTETKRGFITAEKGVQGPVADFSAWPVRGTAPLTVSFTDLSRNDPLSFAWDFNHDDLIDSQEQNPHFTYTDPGTYSVQLTVRAKNGADTELKSSYIVVDEPAPITGTTTARTTPVPTITVPDTTVPLTIPPIPTTHPAPLTKDAPPDYTLLLVLLIAALLLLGSYVLARSRSSKTHSGESRDLHVEVSGGIDYGDGFSSLMDRAESSGKEKSREERGEEEGDEHGSG